MTPYQQKVLEQADHDAIAEDTDTTTILLRHIEKRDELLLELCAQVSPVTANRLRAILEGGE
jgi:16S rRNA C1402 (ribose-2'-O) methylase RsmI